MTPDESIVVKEQHGRFRKIRLMLGSLAQRLAWWLNDPHDSWIIDCRRGSSGYLAIRNGRYSMARCCARELKGKVVGSNAIIIKEQP
jgi:hypothetical protein